MAYQYPPNLVFKMAWAGLTGGRRDFYADARAFIKTMTPPLRVMGNECIPARGPFLLLMNHYYRPGFEVWWLSLAISSRLPMEHSWVTASEWTAAGKWYEPLKGTVSRFLFRRLAGMYGFLPMPPMPPRPQDVMARADAVRMALRYVESHPQAGLCLAPEGRDIGGHLGWPPPGAGRFISLLAARGLHILPVGGWEQEGQLVIQFGAPYRLENEVPGGMKGEGRDRAVAQVVMKSIASLLPESMRGEFA
jgi:hypothetical protein